MAKPSLTIDKVELIYPELKGFVPNGTTDFSTVANIIGSKRPSDVWPIVNLYGSPRRTAAETARLGRLRALLEK